MSGAAPRPGRAGKEEGNREQRELDSLGCKTRHRHCTTVQCPIIRNLCAVPTSETPLPIGINPLFSSFYSTHPSVGSGRERSQCISIRPQCLVNRRISGISQSPHTECDSSHTRGGILRLR